MAQYTLALLDLKGRSLVQIPAGLLYEALQALPGENDPREEARIARTIIAWHRESAGLRLEREQVRKVAWALAALAHHSESQLGRLGWYPPDARGHLIPSATPERIYPVSALVALAMALQALLDMMSVETHIATQEIER